MWELNAAIFISYQNDHHNWRKEERKQNNFRHPTSVRNTREDSKMSLAIFFRRFKRSYNINKINEIVQVKTREHFSCVLSD